MIKELIFEKQFPSLKDKIMKCTLYNHTFDKLEGGSKYILKTDIVNTCLDKRLVKNTILELKTCMMCDELKDVLLEELGIDK